MDAYRFTYLFKYSKPLEDTSSIDCPECQKSIPLTLWKEIDTYCEDCGVHTGTVCTECGEVFDSIWDEAAFEK